MRVIGGRAKGHRLKRVPGEATRPITDRVKENLFNLLGQDVAGTRWLDMFAGTGQVGIEALSRGASYVLFLDISRAAVRVIHENLVHTRLAEAADVRLQDAFDYLGGAAPGTFDVIYVAPPQYLGMWRRALEQIDSRPLDFLAANGLLVAQIDPNEYAALPLQRLELADYRKYGNTALAFYGLATDEEE